MWLYRNLKISWVVHITNKKVLRRMKKETEISYQITEHKVENFGHIMRNSDRYRFLQFILQSKLQGKRSVGRRISWLKNLVFIHLFHYYI